MKRATILFLLILSTLAYGGGYNITTFDQTWVTATYPTAYVSGSFSLNGTGADTFEKNKAGKTLILDLPAGFEFNQSATSDAVASSGTGNISSISFVYNSATQIEVTFTTINSSLIDTIFFNNFEIRATASGSNGTLVRTGGDARLKGLSGGPSAGLPSSTEPFGTYSAEEAMEYTSSAVFQPTTTDLTQYSINNEILRIEVVMTNAGDALNLSQFSLDTDGGNGTGTDDPSNDLSNAKIYYTGSSSTFSTANLYGSLGSVPNGTFNITGAYTLEAGTNYFWLTYDIQGDANTTNSVDASVDGITIDGIDQTDQTTPTPTGKRDITAATFYYAIADGNWTSTAIWSTTDGGASCTCSPNGSGIVVIDTSRAVTLDAARTVDVVNIQNAATLTSANSLTANTSISTEGTGIFTFTSEIYCNGNMDLQGSGTSSASKELNINGDLTIGSGVTLTHSGDGNGGGNGRNLLIEGSLVINGTLSQTGGGDIILDGGTVSMDGNGSITNSNANTEFILSTGDLNILSGSSITVAPLVKIDGAFTVTNSGTFTAQSDISGTNSSSTWTQGISSTLNAQGVILSTGILNASNDGNLVNYFLNGAQTVKVPSSNYHDIFLNSGGTKTLGGNIDIDGALVVQSGVTLDISASNYSINLSENFILHGTFDGTNGNFIFDGTTTLPGSIAPTFGKVTISGTLTSTSSTINMAGNFVNNGTFNHNSGTVDFTGTSTILGTNSTTFNNITVTGTLTAHSSSTVAVNGNWIDNGTFNHNSGTISISGSSAQDISGTSSSTFYNLTNNNSSTGLTLSSPISIDNLLTITDGDIDLNGNNITLASTASVSGESNTQRIFGTSGEVQITLTINSPSSLDVAGLGIVLSGSDNLGSTTIARGHAVQTGNGNTSILRYYDISPTNNTALDMTFRYNYFDSELNGQDENELVLWRSTDGGTTWNNRFGTLNTASNYIELAGITAFSKWVGSNESSNPLPVELVSYSATCDNNNVELIWVTASELNAAYYEISKSEDQQEFSFLDQVSANGTTSEINEYSYMDFNVSQNELIYLLEEYDFDGQHDRLGYTSVSCQSDFKQNFEFYTNQDEIHLKITDGFNNGFVLSVNDVHGRIIHSENIASSDTKDFIVYLPESLSHQLFFLNLQSPVGVISKKFIP